MQNNDNQNSIDLKIYQLFEEFRQIFNIRSARMREHEHDFLFVRRVVSKHCEIISSFGMDTDFKINLVIEHKNMLDRADSLTIAELNEIYKKYK
jgi:hypothetical protein